MKYTKQHHIRLYHTPLWLRSRQTNLFFYNGLSYSQTITVHLLLTVSGTSFIYFLFLSKNVNVPQLQNQFERCFLSTAGLLSWSRRVCPSQTLWLFAHDIKEHLFTTIYMCRHCRLLPHQYLEKRHHVSYSWH